MFITDDLPKRVRDYRNSQVPVLKAARRAGKLAFFSRSEPGKLFVDHIWLPCEKQQAFIKSLPKEAKKPLSPSMPREWRLIRRWSRGTLEELRPGAERGKVENRPTTLRGPERRKARAQIRSHREPGIRTARSRPTILLVSLPTS